MKPVPSACFCYDDMPAMTRNWYDLWKSRGGSIARDTITYMFNRAADFPDLRNYEFKVRWQSIEQRLNVERGRLRRAELIRDAREFGQKAKCDVVKFKKR